MIIVEGPDGAGKTKLIQRLSLNLEIPIKPRVVSSDTEMLVDLQEWVNEDLHEGLKRALYDRHRLISEPIYGPVLRKEMQPGFADARWLRNRQQTLRQIQPYVIFCLPPLEQVRENVFKNDENWVVQESINTIYWLYFNAASSWPGPGMVWDYTTSSYPSLQVDLENWMMQRGLHE